MNRNIARAIRKVEQLRTGASASDALPSVEEIEPTGINLDFNYSEDDDGRLASSAAELMAELRSKGIPVISGGANHQYRCRLNVYQPDVRRSLQLAIDLFGSDRVWVKYSDRWEQIVPGGDLDTTLIESTNVDALLLDEPPASDVSPQDESVPVTGLWLEVVAWEQFDGAYERPYLESMRSNTVARRMSRDSFERLADEHHHFGEELPAADVANFPVDIVYTWVDGDDPAWLESKIAAQASLGLEPSRGSAAAAERFRNRDELRFSLRSVEMYAPWVRKIHIVTAGQCPSWLNVDHPKIELVDHSAIYKDAAWLPTFNSSGIETQLHHVPGLADKFLYFNDDFFLGQFCRIEDFFFGNGVIKYFPSMQKAYEQVIDTSSDEYIQADKNAIELFSREFDSLNRHIMQHVPYPSDRLLLQEMEDKFSEHFDSCGKEPFRSSNDLRPIAFMQYHYGYKYGRAMPARISHRYFALWKDTIFDQLDVLLETRKKTFCINDVGLQPERTEEVNEAVVNFLQTYFPTPSAFENAETGSDGGEN